MGKEQGPVRFVGRTEIAKLQYPLVCDNLLNWSVSGGTSI